MLAGAAWQSPHAARRPVPVTLSLPRLPCSTRCRGGGSRRRRDAHSPAVWRPHQHHFPQRDARAAPGQREVVRSGGAMVSVASAAMRQRGGFRQRCSGCATAGCRLQCSGLPPLPRSGRPCSRRLLISCANLVPRLLPCCPHQGNPPNVRPLTCPYLHPPHPPPPGRRPFCDPSHSLVLNFAMLPSTGNGSAAGEAQVRGRRESRGVIRRVRHAVAGACNPATSLVHPHPPP